MVDFQVWHLKCGNWYHIVGDSYHTQSDVVTVRWTFTLERDHIGDTDSYHMEQCGNCMVLYHCVVTISLCGNCITVW